MSHKLTVIALAAMTLASTIAWAEDAEPSMFSFSGFGTVGVVHSSNDKADFIGRFAPPNGAGYSYNWDGNVDTRLAAQVTAKFTDNLSGVLQVISQQRRDNSYQPLIEWGNLKYAFSPDFSVRLGRIVLPTTLVGDTRNVGYASPWVRPPVELYNLVPLSNSDGVDISYRLHFGDVTNTVQTSYGKSIKTAMILNNLPDIETRRIWGLTDTTEYGAFTLLLSYLQYNLTIPALNSVFDGFKSAPFARYGGNDVAEKYAPDHKNVQYRGIGGTYDPGKWFITGEMGRQNANSMIGDKRAWYISGGYRFGDFTPFATYTKRRTYSNTTDPGIDVNAATAAIAPIAAAAGNAAAAGAAAAGAPVFVQNVARATATAKVLGGVAGGATALNRVLNNAFLRNSDEKTISVGMRWDFMKNADLKVQVDHIMLDSNSQGIFRNIQPGFEYGGTSNVFSLAVDFVF